MPCSTRRWPPPAAGRARRSARRRSALHDVEAPLVGRHGGLREAALLGGLPQPEPGLRHLGGDAQASAREIRGRGSHVGRRRVDGGAELAPQVELPREVEARVPLIEGRGQRPGGPRDRQADEDVLLARVRGVRVSCGRRAERAIRDPAAAARSRSALAARSWLWISASRTSPSRASSWKSSQKGTSPG